MQNFLNRGIELGGVCIVRPTLGQRLGGEKSLQCVVINLIVQSVMEPIQFTFIVAHDDG